MKLDLICKGLLLTATLFLASFGEARGEKHPSLMLTPKGVEQMRSGLEGKTLFHTTLAKTKKDMDAIVSKPFDVPTPKDPGGGYTHERHKKNYEEMQQMATLYQLYKDEKYAHFVKDMLMEYAKMYPTLPLHPVQKSKYRGRLFWQGLNESVWLVHVAQAYDCVYDFLSQKDRTYLEQNLFYPMAKFLSEDNADTFNKIHNHGTWSVSAVGMIGYVMGDKDLVEKSLYGLAKDGNGGFMKQLDLLFSPDGYFTEGPYYQRYALQPFITFGQAIEHNDPDRKIFAYRDGILVKAVNTLLQLANTNGEFFYLNDAMYKTWRNVELVYGVDIIYSVTHDKSLLRIAKEQKRVILSDAGMLVANDLARFPNPQPIEQKTLLVRDGADGSEGGVGLLRMGKGNNQTCVSLKATSHGMAHGHYDKLSIAMHMGAETILQDYGAARYVNIEAKNGGHYLKENDTWAKQTIAHNTLVVDEKSNFDGNIKESSKHNPTITEFTDNMDYKEVAAVDKDAYPGVEMDRRLIMVQAKGWKQPLVVDIYNAKSDAEHQYDMPYYFLGQLMSTNYQYEAYTTTREPLGQANGYQYLWKEAMGKTDKGVAQLTFLNNSKFYTITTAVNADTEIYLNRIGANDPDFNLRNEPAFMLRDKASNRTYLTVVETHGDYKADAEKVSNSTSKIKSVRFADSDQNLVEIETQSGKVIVVDTKNKKCITRSK